MKGDKSCPRCGGRGWWAPQFSDGVGRVRCDRRPVTPPASPLPADEGAAREGLRRLESKVSAWFNGGDLPQDLDVEIMAARAALAQPAPSPASAPEADGCPYGECGNGVICTGCRIDHEMEKALATPLLRYGIDAPSPNPASAPAPQTEGARWLKCPACGHQRALIASCSNCCTDRVVVPLPRASTAPGAPPPVLGMPVRVDPSLSRAVEFVLEPSPSRSGGLPGPDGLCVMCKRPIAEHLPTDRPECVYV